MRSCPHPILGVVLLSLLLGTSSFTTAQTGGADGERPPSVPGGAASPSGGSQARDRLEAEMIVWKILMATASAIDACTQSYAVEFPEKSGMVEIHSEVMKDGSVGRSTARTSLEGARNLRPCLERVAKGWRFPPISRDGEPLSLSIPVKKGNKFVIPKPGEKGEERAPSSSEKTDEGFLQMLPSFLPATWVESPR